MRNAILLSLILAAPGSALGDSPARTVGSLTVTSTAFADGGAIPIELTCEGKELSPPLAWSGVPANTKSIAILVDDPDAARRTVTHWMVSGIAPTTTALATGAALPDGAVAAVNDRGEARYMGPCPPTGRHHYRFRVFALDHRPRATTKAKFSIALAGHILARGEMVGTYERRQPQPNI